MGKLSREISYELIALKQARQEAQQAKRRAKRQQYIRKDLRQLFTKHKGRCVYCGIKCLLMAQLPNESPGPDYATREHVYPRWDIRRMLEDLTGHNKIVLACRKCNEDKGQEHNRTFAYAKPTDEFNNLLIDVCKTLQLLQ